MDLKLIVAKFDDLDTILQMQIEAFSELYAKYQDTEEFAVFNIKAFHQQSQQGITRVATTKPLAYPTYTITNVIKDDNFFQLKTTIIGYSPTI